MFGFGVPSVTTTQLAERMQAKKVTILDVREPYEYAAGHVKGAKNVPLGTLPSYLTRLDKDAETYVICQSGNRSVQGTKVLMRAGFSDVKNVKGGTSAWRGKLAR